MALFTKKFADGSVFDYSHGYHSAEEVERLKAEGTYQEGENDVEGNANLIKALGILLFLAVLAALIIIPATIASHTAENKRALIDGLNNYPGVSVVNGSVKDGSVLVRVQEGEKGTSMLNCTTEAFEENDQNNVAVFCTPGAPAVAVIPVPHGDFEIF